MPLDHKDPQDPQVDHKDHKDHKDPALSCFVPPTTSSVATVAQPAQALTTSLLDFVLVDATPLAPATHS